MDNSFEMLEEAGSPGEFKTRIQQTGNMVSTAKAESHDRYDNRCFNHLAFDCYPLPH